KDPRAPGVVWNLPVGLDGSPRRGELRAVVDPKVVEPLRRSGELGLKCRALLDIPCGVAGADEGAELGRAEPLRREVERRESRGRIRGGRCLIAGGGHQGQLGALVPQRDLRWPALSVPGGRSEAERGAGGDDHSWPTSDQKHRQHARPRSAGALHRAPPGAGAGTCGSTGRSKIWPVFLPNQSTNPSVFAAFLAAQPVAKNCLRTNGWSRQGFPYATPNVPSTEYVSSPSRVASFSRAGMLATSARS